MSDQLSTAFVRQYHSNIALLLQQKGGVLRPWVRNETQQSEKQFYEQIGSISAEQVTTRFAESPVTNTPHDRRMVTILPYAVGDFIDTFEKVQTLIDPANTYVQNFVRALGRESDRVIFQAFFGDAFTGKEGTTVESYGTAETTAGGNIVAADFNTADSGLIVAKLVEAKRAGDALHWPMDQQRYIVLNSSGMADLLNQTAVTSADFNTVRALVRGEVDSFMGFKFVQWEGYVLSGTNVMLVAPPSGDATTAFVYPVFQKEALLYAVGIEPQTEITRRPDRSFHWYAYARMMCGATRMELNRVIMIERFVS